MSDLLVIFDCDGVLVDSERISHACLAASAAEVGLHVEHAEAIVLFKGRSMADCVAIIEARIGGSVPEDFVARFRARSYEAFRREITPVAGVVDALDRIPLPSCVASSGPHDKIELTLTTCGLIDRFRGRIFSAYDVGRFKPEPDVFLHAAATLGVDPSRCVVVEDSALGVQAALAAGMTAFGFADLSPPESLEAAGARVFGDMAELPDLVEAWAR